MGKSDAVVYKNQVQREQEESNMRNAALTQVGKASWHSRQAAVFLSVGLLLCHAGLSLADSAAPEQSRLALQGFGTLGWVRSDDDNAAFIRDLSQPKGAGTAWTAKVDSLLGIQATYTFSPQTEMVLQAVSRYHANDSYDPELTWAFLRHEFSPDLSLRAGRLGTEFYMLGDSRLVGYSNLTLRPPPDFYGSLVFSYIDGVDVSKTMPVGNGLLSGKLFAGLSPEITPYGPASTWNQRGDTLLGGYLDFFSGPWQVRLSHARVRFNHEPPTDAFLQTELGDPLVGTPYLALVPEMALADRWVHFGSLGLVYDQGPLNVQLMLNRIRHESPAYADSQAGYLQAAYRLGQVTPYIGISRSKSLAETLPSTDFITKILTDLGRTNQYTYTLGGRWDFRQNLALKAQVDWIRGHPDSLFLYKDLDPANWDGRMTVFSLALDFVF